MPWFDEPTIKALGSAGSTVLMFLVVVGMLWGASRLMLGVNSIATRFAEEVESSRKDCQAHTTQLTEKIFEAQQAFRSQLADIHRETTSVVDRLVATVASLESFIRGQRGGHASQS